MPNQRRETLKAVLLTVSQFQLLMGLAVSLVGLHLWVQYSQWSLLFSSSLNLTQFVLFTLAAGALLVFSSFLASWVCRTKSTCLQGLFVYALVVVFCLGSTSSALALHHSHNLDSEMHPLSGVFQNYTGSSQDPGSRAVDALQETMECCGVHNYTDWWNTSWFKQTGGQMPVSCCKPTLAPCNDVVLMPLLVHNVGCQDKLQSVFHNNLSILVQMFYMVFVVLVILFVTIVNLMSEPTSSRYQSL